MVKLKIKLKDLPVFLKNKKLKLYWPKNTKSW